MRQKINSQIDKVPGAKYARCSLASKLAIAAFLFSFVSATSVSYIFFRSSSSLLLENVSFASERPALKDSPEWSDSGGVAGEENDFPLRGKPSITQQHRQLKSTFYNSLLAGLGISILMGLAALYLSRLLVSRISRMTNAIRCFHESGEELVVPQNSGDEIGELARSFDMLRQRMNQAVVSQHLSSLQEKEAKDRLQAIFNSAADAMITIEESGAIISFNNAAETMFGYAEHEILLQQVSLLVPEFYALHHDEYIKNYLVTGNRKIIGKQRELVGVRKNGEQFDIQIAVSHVKTANGNLFSGIISDISLRKEKEKQLADARKYIDGITNAVPTLLSYIDIKKVFRFANKNYQTWFDVDIEKIPGSPIGHVFGRDKCDEIYHHIDKALTGDFHRSELQIKIADGSLRFVQATYTPDINAEGQVDGVFVGLEDISEMKAKKDQLRVLSTRLEFALKAPGIGVWDYNVVTGELIWDARMCQLYGIGDGQFAGTLAAWESRLFEDDVSAVRAALNNSLTSKQNFYAEFRISHPMLGVRYVEANGQLLVDGAGEIVQMIGTNSDVTDRVELIQQREVALQRANDAARLKSDFLASMSHEIRTPMNGVMGMLGLLKRSDLNEKQNRYLGIAYSSAQALLTIINDILDFSKIEAGKIEIELVDFDLRVLLGDVAKSMVLKAQEKGLELVLDTCRVNLTAVKGDPGRLRQILVNLVGNAIKFTDRGEVVIRAEIHQQDNDELRFLCAVEDTGIGIAQDKIGSVFDSFSQLDASTTRKYGGTGLGLSIATKLCELMKGAIRVESEVGVGSCFSFDIELHQSEKAHHFLPDIKLAGASILIVDDNDTYRSALKKQLSFWGAAVDDVAGVDAAWDLLQVRGKSGAGMYKVIFIDMTMPEKDGSELAKLLLADHCFDGVQRVLMAPMRFTGNEDAFSSLGFDAYFFKPATMHDLHAVFAIVLTDDLNKLSVDNVVALPFSASKRLTEQTRLYASVPDKSGAGKLAAVKSKIEMHTERILVVEDNRNNIDVVMGMLEELKRTADSCGNGVEALAALRSAPEDAPYELILMDCQMPEMDGYETTTCIRKSAAGARYANIPVIAMTANAMKGDRERCLAAGMNDYLSKPISLDVLEDKLTRFLDNNDARSKRLSDAGEANPVVLDKIAVPVWDRDLALQRVGNKRARMEKLATMFITSMPQHIADLCHAIENDIPDLIVLEASTIKCLAGNLAVYQLMEMARTIENLYRVHQIAEVKILIPELRHVFNESMQSLQDFLDTPC